MKQIKKNTTPDAFLQWQAAKEPDILRLKELGKSGDDLWALLPSSLSKDTVENDYSKAMLRKSLLEEQYYLCCYCNDIVKGESLDTKVEHFLPKESYKDTVFEYQNLFAACNGGERARPVELSCDSEKGKKDPLEINILSPLTEDVDTHFSYRESGEIEGETEEGKSTVSRLNLNCKRLQLRRKTVIEEFIYDEEMSIEELREEALAIIDGKHQAFCMAIVSILKYYD